MVNTQIDEDYLDHIDELWREHRKTSFEISPTEWAKVFPEGRNMVSRLLLNNINKLDKIKDKLRKEIERLADCDEDRQLIGEVCLEIGLAKQAIEIQKKISWYSRYMACFVEDRAEITDEIIQKAREVSLSDIVPDLKLRSGKLIRCCPFHEERTPSFTVFPQNNSYYCFGCGESGNPIDYVMKSQNLIFLEAVKYLLRL